MYELDKALDLRAHEIFWQLLMEGKFINQVVAKFTSFPSTDTASGSQGLTYMEENAIRYTAGYVIRKLVFQAEEPSSPTVHISTERDGWDTLDPHEVFIMQL